MKKPRKRQKTFTLRQFINAMRKNGYKQAYGHLVISDEDGSVHSACAMGQAGLNLGVDPMTLFDIYQGIPFNIRKDVVSLNDQVRMPLPAIADFIQEKFRNRLHEKYTVKWVEA